MKMKYITYIIFLQKRKNIIRNYKYYCVEK